MVSPQGNVWAYPSHCQAGLIDDSHNGLNDLRFCFVCIDNLGFLGRLVCCIE